MLRKILLGSLIYSLSFYVHARDDNDSPAVVELFTSQGCYSCPPADKLLGKLKKRPNTITLACHVTYWNYLGWRDTFSSAFCDNRQRSYQQHLKGRAGVYTPQMVINGTTAALGSAASQINNYLDHDENKVTSIKVTAIKVIQLKLTDDNQITIQLPELNQERTQQLLLLGTSGEHNLPIPCRKPENSTAFLN